LERALAIREQALGSDHFATATSLYALANLLADQREYGAACPLLERALAIFEQVRGPDHLSTVTVRDDLAALRAKLGDEGAPPP
jgi:hypothetical protein